MRNKWFLWLFLGGVLVTVLIILNYEGGKKTMPLSEIFPENEGAEEDVQYEFVSAEADLAAAVDKVLQRQNGAPQKQQPTDIQEVKTGSDTTTLKEISIPKLSPVVDSAPYQSEMGSEVAQAPAAYKYAIQVASFQQKNRAEAALNQLKQKNYVGRIIEKTLEGKGTWHRVLVGKFDNKSQAENLLQAIKKDYKDSFITATK